MKTIRIKKIPSAPDGYFEAIMTHAAVDVYPAVVSESLRKALLAEGYEEVAINIDGVFYALGDRGKFNRWHKITAEQGENITVVDCSLCQKFRPLDAATDVYGASIPQVLLCSFLDLRTGSVKFRSASDGKILMEKPMVTKATEQPNHSYTKYVNVKTGLTGPDLAEAIFGEFSRSQLAEDLRQRGFGGVVIGTDGEFVALKEGEDHPVVDGKIQKSDFSEPLNIFEWADESYGGYAPHTNLTLRLRDMTVHLIGIHGHVIRQYELKGHEDKKQMNEEETQPVPVKEEINPKDVIGSSKIPMTLWPATATAYGAVGLFNGALKYGKANFRATPVKTSIYVDACMRHLASYMEGEEVDPDDGVPHLAAALASLAIIVDAKTSGTLIDDRQIESSGFRETMNELTGHVKRLQELHADKSPKHHIRGSEDK